MTKHIIVMIIAISLITFACKDKSTNSDGDAIFRQGEWEFTWYNPSPNTGLVLLGFTGGQLKISANNVCYDSDCILNGPINGSTWSGTSGVSNGSSYYSFSGNFIGNPATSFEGSWTLPNGQRGPMTGHFVN